MPFHCFLASVSTYVYLSKTIAYQGVKGIYGFSGEITTVPFVFYFITGRSEGDAFPDQFLENKKNPCDGENRDTPYIFFKTGVKNL